MRRTMEICNLFLTLGIIRVYSVLIKRNEHFQLNDAVSRFVCMASEGFHVHLYLSMPLSTLTSM